MSAYPVSDSIYPPTFFRRFEAATLAAGAVVLHSTNAPGTDTFAGDPLKAQHLPCQLIVEAGDVDDALEVTDVTGTTVVLVFPVAGTYVLRMAPVSIGGSAATDVDAVTVCWTQKG